MLLRASGQHTGEEIDLANINAAGLEASRIPDAGLLVGFADAFFTPGGRLAEARAEILAGLGPGALVDAAGVVAIFDAVVRIADATGIPLESFKEEASRDFRAALGIEAYPTAGEGRIRG